MVLNLKFTAIFISIYFKITVSNLHIENIFFLTVKTNAISTQVCYNSTEDIPGPC